MKPVEQIEQLSELLTNAGIENHIDKNAPWLLRLDNMTAGYYKDQDIFQIFHNNLNGKICCLSLTETYEDIKRTKGLK